MTSNTTSVHGRSVIAPRRYDAGELIGRLHGEERETPSVHSIQIGASKHLELPEGSAEELSFRYLNHSCDPNAVIDSRRRAIVALTPIEAGEEITFDYLTTEWLMYQPFECRCGAERCRGWIAGYANAEPHVRAELGSQAAPYLRALAAQDPEPA